MVDYAVKIPFIGSDSSLSGSIDRMTGKMRSMDKYSHSVFRRMRKDALSVKSVMGGILGARAVTAGLGVVRNEVSEITDEIIKLDSASVAAAARFGFDRQSKEFKQLTTEARSVGAATKFTAGEAAGALDFFAKAGYNLQDSLKLVAPTAKLAQASGLDLATTADIASDSLGAFGLKVDQYKKASDILAFTANSTNTTLDEMFETIKMGGPVVKLAQGDLSTFSSLIRPMASAGIKGTLAATALKNAILNMTAGTGSAKKEMSRLQVKIKDSSGNLLDLVDILGQLETKFNKMGSAQRLKSMNDIFGKRAVAGMSAIFDQGIKQSKDANKQTIEQLREQARNADGYVEEQARKMSMSYENKILSIKSAVAEVGFTIIDSFGKDIPRYLDLAIKKIRSINPKDIQKGIKDFIDILKTVKSTISFLTPIIKTAISAWIGYKSVMMAIIAIDTVRHINAVARGLLGCSSNAKLLTGNLNNVNNVTGNINGGLSTALTKTQQWAGAAALVVASLKAGYEVGKIINEKYIEPLNKEGTKRREEAQATTDTTRWKDIEKMDKEQLNKKLLDIRVAKIKAATGFSGSEDAAGMVVSAFTGSESPLERNKRLVGDLSTKQSMVEYRLRELAKQDEQAKKTYDEFSDIFDQYNQKIIDNNNLTLDKINQIEKQMMNASNGEPQANKINIESKVSVDNNITFNNAPSEPVIKTTVNSPKPQRSTLGVN